MAQEPAFARPGLSRHGTIAADRRHVLQHHPARAPMRPAARHLTFAKGQHKAAGQLFGLREIGFGTRGQRAARDRGKALIGHHAFALIDHHGKIPVADLAKGGSVMIQTVRIIAGIGANARGLTLFRRTVIVSGNQPGRALAAHLQRKLPAQFHRLADQRCQQRHLGHQRFDHGRIAVLLQHLIQNTVQTGDTATHIGAVKLKGKDGIVPGDGLRGHMGFPKSAVLGIPRLYSQGNRRTKGAS